MILLLILAKVKKETNMETMVVEKNLEEKIGIVNTFRTHPNIHAKEKDYFLLRIDALKIGSSPTMSISNILGKSEFTVRVSVNKNDNRWEIKVHYSEENIYEARELYDKIKSFYK